MKKAIVFGASGFIGSHVLQELLSDDDYQQVTIVVRKDPGITHPKLKTWIGDLQTLVLLKPELVGDEIFIALGTTKKHTPDQRDYYKIDHDLPVLAAKIAKENGTRSVFIVTAVGANPNSSMFYTRTKGEIERDIIALNFDHTHIFEPSMILGNRKENRPGEKLFMNLFRFVSLLLAGGLNKYKGIDGKDVARAMHNAARNHPGSMGSEKVKIYRWREMTNLL